MGDGAKNLITQYLKFYHTKRIFLVTDRGVQNTGLISHIEKKLRSEHFDYAVFNGISPNPRDFEVMQGVEEYRASNCDMIVAIGGGSVIDAAKGIAIVVTNHEHINSFEGVDKIHLPIPPLICIPTTAGTSADISQFSIILNSEEKKKIAIVSKAIIPDLSLIDAETSLSMPHELTSATGMDVLSHAVEALASNASSAITDLNAIEAIKLTKKYLPLVLKNPNNLAYRNQMMQASLLAGMAFSNASLGLIHAIAHALGGLKDSSHGLCNAILIDHVINYNFDSNPEKYLQIAELFGVDIKNTNASNVASSLIEELQAFKHQCNICASLKELNVMKEDFQGIAIKALNDPCIVTNPKDCTSSEIEKILTHSW